MLLINPELKNGKNERVLYHIIKDGYPTITYKPILIHDFFTNTNEIPTGFSISDAMSKPYAIRRIVDLVDSEKYSDIDFKVIENKGFFILARGGQNQLKELPKYFYKNANTKLSTAGWLKHKVGQFKKLKEHDTHFSIEDKLTLEEFSNLDTYAFDTEFMFWEDEFKLDDLNVEIDDIKSFLDGELIPYNQNNSKEGLTSLLQTHINSNIQQKYVKQPLSLQLAKLTKNKLSKEDMHEVIYFEHLTGKSEEAIIDLQTGSAKLINRKSDNALLMVRDFEKFLDKHPGIILISQNGMNYDLLELRKFVERQDKKNPFKINGSTPVIDSAAGFYKKVLLKNLYHIDMAAYFQNYMPLSLNNKFETVVKLILNKPITKSITYDEQSTMSIEQLLGSTEAGLKSKIYGCEDVTLLSEIKNYILPIVYLKCNLFNRSPEDICVTSKKSLAKKLYEYKYVQTHFQSIKLSKEKIKQYNDLSSGQVFGDLLKKTKYKHPVVLGTHDSTIYYIAPFLKVLYPLIRKNSEVKEIFEYIKELKIDDTNCTSKNNYHQDRLARFDLINTIEEGYLIPYVQEQLNKGFKDYSIDDVLDNALVLFNRFQPINANGNFICFETIDTVTDEFKKLTKGLAFPVADGKILNIDKGSFALYDGVSILKKGIDVKGSHGFKTLYEKELIENVIEKSLMHSPCVALDYVNEFILNIENGQIDVNKLIYFKSKITRDYFDYSSTAQKQERIKLYVKYGKMKGDQFAKAVLKTGTYNLTELEKIPRDEILSDENVDFILNQYFGPKMDFTRDFKQGRVGKILHSIMYQDLFS